MSDVCVIQSLNQLTYQIAYICTGQISFYTIFVNS